MPVRNVGKWVCVAFIAWVTGGAVASCGGAGNGSVFTDAGTDANAGGDAPTDSTTGGGDGPVLVGGDGGDSTTGCTAKTCAQLGYNCGKAVSCGQVIDCGGDAANLGCPVGQICGANGVDNVCGTSVSDGGNGDGGACTPKTCQQLGYNCGLAIDGCGNVIDCSPTDSGSGCTPPEYCGGGGFDQCGTGIDAGSGDSGSGCVGKTCQQLAYNCGAADDGCGNIIQCGTCTAPQYCGGGGYDVCGPTNIEICDGGTASTSLTGFVYDPANHLPVYNALVYAPVGAVQTPDTGVSAATCGCTAPPAYASAYTGINGAFTLTGVPSGSAVTIVVQLGKWQRAFTENIAPCQTNALTSNLTLPSTSAEGNIPRFAIDTGGVDAMECVLLKMGIAQSEFADPNLNAGGVPQATQRIQMYEGKIVSGGAVIDATTPPEKDLTENLTTLESYDVALFPCQGGAGTYDSANGYPNTLGNLVSYADVGGRAFMTHYHYDMLDGNGTFSGTANWHLNAGSWGNYYGDTKYNADIEQTGFPTGVELADWLNQPVVYGGTLGVIPVGVIREDFTSVNAPAQLWLYTAGTKNGPGANLPIHYTFDTPFNQTPTCGRVVYSDFHVESQPNATEFTGEIFPNECPGGTAPTSMTPQEELLEFMLFDLTSCVSPPVCTPLTCSSFPAGTCGQQGDGCGGLTADCGTCTAPQTCGGGGVPGQCGAPDAGSCQPQTCTQQKIGCGAASDGCGNVLNCGSCPTGSSCVGGQCISNDAGTCSPKSCAEQGLECGVASDGCGNIIQCPNCPTGETCNTSTGQCQQNSQ